MGKLGNNGREEEAGAGSEEGRGQAFFGPSRPRDRIPLGNAESPGKILDLIKRTRRGNHVSRAHLLAIDGVVSLEKGSLGLRSVR